MDKTIQINVKGQYVSRGAGDGGVTGSGNVDRLRISFDESWDGYAKTATFWDANGENPVKVILGTNMLDSTDELGRTYLIPIPPEPLAVEGEYIAVIDGTVEGKRGRSETILLHAEYAPMDDDAGEPADPTPTQAEQLQAEIDAIKEDIVDAAAAADAKEAAQAAALAAESSASEAEISAEEAAESASGAALSKQHALNAEQGASGYAQDAAYSANEARQSLIRAEEAGNSAKDFADNAQASANAAAEAVKHYPRINPATMTWLVWDAMQGEFVDTGVIAEGRNGIEADGLWGVYVDEEGFLVVTYSGDDPPPLSISDDGYLVYTLNGQEIRVGKTVGPEGPAGLGVPEATPEDTDKIPIVAPDGTYKLGYQSGAIDDTKAQTDKTWSSLTTVDRLAPAFESSGPVVTCNPVEGYPLHVVSQIVPVQEGEGDPSPENVRPISGWSEVTLTHNDTPVTIQFGQTVYGGELDWTTGVLTVGSIFLKLDTTYAIGLYQFRDKNGVFFSSPLLYSPSRIEGVCSHGICTTYPSISSDSWIWIGVNNPFVYWIGVLDVLGLSTVDEFKSWLDTQDVQIVYPMQEPVTIQLTPHEILALSGTNNIYADTGDVTVSGRADPNTIIQQLAARIAALESAVVSN